MITSDIDLYNDRHRFFSNTLAIMMLIFLIPISILILITLVYGYSFLDFMASISPLFIIALKSNHIINKLIDNDKRLMFSFFISSARGLKIRYIKLKAMLLLCLVNTTIPLAILLLLSILFYRVVITLLFILPVLAGASVAIYYSTRIYISLSISSRRTSINIEAPYFLILTRVLSSITMPFYDVLSIVENSVSLKTFAKEIKFAKKISTIKNISLITAIDMMCLNHPSDIMRDYVRRITVAASSMGDIRSVTESSFEAVYSVFESKVAKLVERFTIVVGSALFAYLFIPVIVAAIAPVIGVNVLQIIAFALGFQVMVFFILYAISTSYYPSSLVITYTKDLAYISAILLTFALGIGMYNILSYLAKLPLIDSFILHIMLIAILAPGIVVSEKAYRRATLYDKFTRIAADAASLATATGENYLLVLERISTRYGRNMLKFVKRISTSYTSETLRKAVVASAPSLFHSSFAETLMYILLYGASPEMLKSFATSYERIVTLVSRVRSMAISIEMIIIGLSVMVGGFLAYLSKVFRDIAQLTGEVAGTGLGFTRFFVYNPIVYGLLDAIAIFSLILVSMFIGKIRGGAIVFGFRTSVLVLALYFIAKTLAELII